MRSVNTEHIGCVDSGDANTVYLLKIFLDFDFVHGLGDSEDVGA